MPAITRLKNLILLTGFVVAPLGCQSGQLSPGTVEVTSVKGKVIFNGQPTPGATVTFHPIGGVSAKTPTAFGIVGDDGSFQLTTYLQNDGAAPGKYKVTVYWAKPVKSEEDGPPLLPLKYADPQSSGLEADIQKGANDLRPFDLKP